MKRNSIIILVVTSLIIGGLVYNRISKNKEKASQQDSRPAAQSGVQVYGSVVTGETFSDFLSLSGSLEADEHIEIHAEVSGIVESINFVEGAAVGQGQVLLTINDAELQAQLAQAETRNNLAAENERRAKLLLEKEAISQEEYDIASADYRTAQSQIQLIQAQLNKTVIKAPFSGTIGLRNISKGSYVTPTTNIAQLVKTDRLKVTFSIPEKYANIIRLDNEVRFHVQGVEGEYSAKIYATEPAVEANTRTLTVKAMMSNPQQRLIPGTFANIVFPLETIEDGLMVPAEALIPIQNGKKLFILKDGHASEIVVETGARTEENVLVTTGLQSGDTVLTSGVMALRDGARVDVTLR